MSDEKKEYINLPSYIGSYEIKEKINEGGYSKVYLGLSKYTKDKVSIKIIDKSLLIKNPDDLLLFKNEIDILKLLKHRNIMTLYEIYESPNYIFIITEYLSHELINLILKKKRLKESDALKIFVQLVDALLYIHKMKICHRDIRIEHILFDKNNIPKIIDFGYSCFYEKGESLKEPIGSLSYACPEIIQGKSYDPELADVWSLGVCLYVMVYGYLPFSEEDDEKNNQLIISGKVDYPKEIGNICKDLIKKMLEVNPEKRYNLLKISRHPWVKSSKKILIIGGYNIYEMIYPVDERLLKIINEYGVDSKKVEKELKLNKFNIYTGLFKLISKKVLELKYETISDFTSHSFIEYKKDKKNIIENGEEKYEDFLEKIKEKNDQILKSISEYKKKVNSIISKLDELKIIKDVEGQNEEKKNNYEIKKNIQQNNDNNKLFIRQSSVHNTIINKTNYKKQKNLIIQKFIEENKDNFNNSNDLNINKKIIRKNSPKNNNKTLKLNLELIYEEKEIEKLQSNFKNKKDAGKRKTQLFTIFRNSPKRLRKTSISSPSQLELLKRNPTYKKKAKIQFFVEEQEDESNKSEKSDDNEKSEDSKVNKVDDIKSKKSKNEERDKYSFSFEEDEESSNSNENWREQYYEDKSNDENENESNKDITVNKENEIIIDNEKENDDNEVNNLKEDKKQNCKTFLFDINKGNIITNLVHFHENNSYNYINKIEIIRRNSNLNSNDNNLPKVNMEQINIKKEPHIKGRNDDLKMKNNKDINNIDKKFGKENTTYHKENEFDDNHILIKKNINNKKEENINIVKIPNLKINNKNNGKKLINKYENNDKKSRENKRYLCENDDNENRNIKMIDNIIEIKNEDYIEENNEKKNILKNKSSKKKKKTIPKIKEDISLEIKNEKSKKKKKQKTEVIKIEEDINKKKYKNIDNKSDTFLLNVLKRKNNKFKTISPKQEGIHLKSSNENINTDNDFDLIYEINSPLLSKSNNIKNNDNIRKSNQIRGSRNMNKNIKNNPKSKENKIKNDDNKKLSFFLKSDEKGSTKCIQSKEIKNLKNNSLLNKIKKSNDKENNHIEGDIMKDDKNLFQNIYNKKNNRNNIKKLTINKPIFISNKDIYINNLSNKNSENINFKKIKSNILYSININTISYNKNRYKSQPNKLLDSNEEEKNSKKEKRLIKQKNKLKKELSKINNNHNHNFLINNININRKNQKKMTIENNYKYKKEISKNIKTINYNNEELTKDNQMSPKNKNKYKSSKEIMKYENNDFLLLNKKPKEEKNSPMKQKFGKEVLIDINDNNNNNLQHKLSKVSDKSFNTKAQDEPLKFITNYYIKKDKINKKNINENINDNNKVKTKNNTVFDIMKNINISKSNNFNQINNEIKSKLNKFRGKNEIKEINDINDYDKNYIETQNEQELNHNKIYNIMNSSEFNNNQFSPNTKKKPRKIISLNNNEIRKNIIMKRKIGNNN